MALLFQVQATSQRELWGSAISPRTFEWRCFITIAQSLVERLQSVAWANSKRVVQITYHSLICLDGIFAISCAPLQVHQASRHIFVTGTTSLLCSCFAMAVILVAPSSAGALSHRASLPC